jgi:hypothetical protein
VAKVTLQDIQSGYSAPATINANNDAIAEAIENTFSRDGTGPNQMETSIDMNGYRITNLPAPVDPNDPARYADLTGLLELDPTGLIVPSMTGNEGKVLSTNGTAASWTDVDPDALPLFDGTDPGAVPAYTTGTEILTAAGWAEPDALGLVVDDPDAVPEGALNLAGVSLAYSATRAIDTELGNVFWNTLTGNTTFSFTNAVEGRHFTLFVSQDSTGGRAATWPTIIWSNGHEGALATGANDVTTFDFYYDGTDWYGKSTSISTGVDDEDAYDLAITHNDFNVDLFRRLGSPTSAGAYTVLVAPGVVVSSNIYGKQALLAGGAFPSGTTITVTNLGYIVGLGGDGDGGAAAIDDDGSEHFAFGVRSSYKNGSDAIQGPASGVTLYIVNAAGRVWGGGGGGGSGGATSNASNTAAASGPGGGGAGGGRGGQPFIVQGHLTAGATAVSTAGGQGGINLDGSSSAGAAGVKDEDGGFAGDGGAGGDFGAAGAAGTAAAAGDANNVVAATSGGTAGRAVTAGYAGTVTFVSGSGSPNVKGSV